eukprot:ctg_1625.g369
MRALGQFFALALTKDRYAYWAEMRSVRRPLAKTILLSLDFLLAADVVDTLGDVKAATAPDLFKLAALVLLRAFMSFHLTEECKSRGGMGPEGAEEERGAVDDGVNRDVWNACCCDLCSSTVDRPPVSGHAVKGLPAGRPIRRLVDKMLPDPMDVGSSVKSASRETDALLPKPTDTGTRSADASLTTRQLLELSSAMAAIQFSYATEFAFGTPYFRLRNVSYSVLPLIWLAGPFSGFLVQPLVGHWSDRVGRRWPFIALGALFIIGGMALMASADWAGRTLFGDVCAPGPRCHATVALATVGGPGTGQPADAGQQHHHPVDGGGEPGRQPVGDLLARWHPAGARGGYGGGGVDRLAHRAGGASAGRWPAHATTPVSRRR